MFFHVGAIFWSTTWPKSRVLKTRNFTKNLAQSSRKTWIFQVLSLKAILDNFCKIMVKFVVFWLFEAFKYLFKSNPVIERQFPEFYSIRRYRYGTALAVAVAEVGAGSLWTPPVSTTMDLQYVPEQSCVVGVADVTSKVPFCKPKGIFFHGLKTKHYFNP